RDRGYCGEDEDGESTNRKASSEAHRSLLAPMYASVGGPSIDMIRQDGGCGSAERRDRASNFARRREPRVRHRAAKRGAAAVAHRARDALGPRSGYGHPRGADHHAAAIALVTPAARVEAVLAVEGLDDPVQVAVRYLGQRLEIHDHRLVGDVGQELVECSR